MLDEPTSGLDSTAAHEVIQLLKNVATGGRVVIMSLHQPSTQVFALFDQVLLLARGKQIYQGPPGTSALKFFASLGYPCPEFTNPAEHFLDVINTDFNSSVDDNKLSDFANSYRASSVAKELRKTNLDSHDDPDAFAKSVQSAGPLLQFLVLLRRMLHMAWKNPGMWLVRIVMYLILSLMVGTMYLGKGGDAREDTGFKGQDAAKSLLPLLFYVQAFLVFMSIAILPFFLEIRDVFRRERANGQITCAPYVLADFFANLPGIALIAVLSSVLVVFLADLNSFGGFFLNLFLSLMVAESLMRLIGAAQPHYIIGMAFGAGLFGMFMLCEGFMVPRSGISTGWLWGHYLASHSYSFKWFVYNQFQGRNGGVAGPAILDLYGCGDVKPVEMALILLCYAIVFQIEFFGVLQVFHTGRR